MPPVGVSPSNGCATQRPLEHGTTTFLMTMNSQVGFKRTILRLAWRAAAGIGSVREYVRAASLSFVPEREDGIHLHRAPSRQITRQQRDPEQQARYRREGPRIVCTDFIEQTPHEPRQGERRKRSDAEAGQSQQDSFLKN